MDALSAFVAKHPDGYMFDVSDDAAKGRQMELGIIGVSGTNLIQQTDQSIARYHIPVTLFDTGSGSRAAFAAYWLRSMGFSVRVALLPAGLKEASSPAPRQDNMETGSPRVTLEQLIAHRDLPRPVFDFRPSSSFRKAKLNGREWRNISEVLSSDPSADQPAEPAMIIANDPAHGHETAGLLAEQGWRISGIYIWDCRGPDRADIQPGQLGTVIDESALFARRHHGNMQDSRDYLAWEEELPSQIDHAIFDMWQRLLAS